MARKKATLKFDLNEADFGTLCICSIRYSLGRQTYMPSLVQDIIRPHLHRLSDKDLFVIERDISEADDRRYGYGDPTIDRPGWLRFLAEVRMEQARRKTESMGRREDCGVG